MTSEDTVAPEPEVATRHLVLRDLGLTKYEPTLQIQRKSQAELRADASAPGLLLLTEHEPVFTLGRNHPNPDLRVPATVVAAAGIPIVQAERGGDITYHGPGQLVAYPIVNLRAWRLGAVDYVAALEETAIKMLAAYGIDAGRRDGARGAWVGTRKISSVGVNVRGGVSMHGIALNVDPNLDHFEMINACGLGNVEITSIAREGGDADPLVAKSRFLEAFREVFECVLEST